MIAIENVYRIDWSFLCMFYEEALQQIFMLQSFFFQKG